MMVRRLRSSMWRRRRLRPPREPPRCWPNRREFAPLFPIMPHRAFDSMLAQRESQRGRKSAVQDTLDSRYTVWLSIIYIYCIAVVIKAVLRSTQSRHHHRSRDKLLEETRFELKFVEMCGVPTFHAFPLCALLGRGKPLYTMNQHRGQHVHVTHVRKAYAFHKLTVVPLAGAAHPKGNPRAQ